MLIVNVNPTARWGSIVRLILISASIVLNLNLQSVFAHCSVFNFITVPCSMLNVKCSVQCEVYICLCSMSIFTGSKFDVKCSKFNAAGCMIEGWISQQSWTFPDEHFWIFECFFLLPLQGYRLRQTIWPFILMICFIFPIFIFLFKDFWFWFWNFQCCFEDFEIISHQPPVWWSPLVHCGNWQSTDNVVNAKVMD